MRTVSVTIGSLLVFGAAVAFLNCGDDSSTGGAGATGGSGGSGATGGSGGSGGASGASAGAGGSSGAGMPEGGTTGGSAGASGSGGKAGASGASGSGGKAGNGGAAGSGGKAGNSGAGGAGGSPGKDASTDGPSCPANAPQPGSACTAELDCIYGTIVCTCIDPGPNGTWGCSGGPQPEGGSGDAGGMCPAAEPIGESCPDAGLPIGPCLYSGGHLSCSCPVGAADWACEQHAH
jgi:hypothetical protein